MRKHGRSARSDALRGKNCNKYTFLVLAFADRVFALERGAVFHEDRPRRC